MQRNPVKRFVVAAAVLWVTSSFPLPASAASQPKTHPDPISRLLNARLKSGGHFGDIVLEIEWPFESLHPVCRLYGNGVGIWNRKVQFRLPQSEMTSLLQAVARARFGSLPDTIGGIEKEAKTLKGRITVSIGDETKSVAQLQGGNQSQTLQSLAERVLGASKKAAKQGVGASSFVDGFGKLLSGTLAPEGFDVILETRASPTGKRALQTRTLRLDGRRGSVRVMEGGVEVRGETRELVISKTDYDALLRLLRDSGLETLHRNLYSAQETSLRIQVLDRVCAVQAGPSPGTTARAHGAAQKSFDRICTALLALQARVEKEGVPPGVKPGTSRRPTPG
jgi:hypothetical protein